jgi:ABC-type nickel/cobalt efflux system permease component RcnA
VYALGGIALFASHYVLPEQLYPWLGFSSGLFIMGMGVVLLTQAWRRHHAHSPSHSHDHPHPHNHKRDECRVPGVGFSHSHDHQEPEKVSYGALLTLGITGGMIPCPAALVVLLSAVALQRIAFGLLLIAAFSLGLAAVLVGTGLLLVSARGVVQRWSGEGSWLAYLPFFSPLVITPLGLMIALRSLLGTGVVPGLPF